MDDVLNAEGGGDRVDAAPEPVERASGVKCERCWRYVSSVSSDPAWAGICERCQEALAETLNPAGAPAARRRANG